MWFDPKQAVLVVEAFFEVVEELNGDVNRSEKEGPEGNEEEQFADFKDELQSDVSFEAETNLILDFDERADFDVDEKLPEVDLDLGYI